MTDNDAVSFNAMTGAVSKDHDDWQCGPNDIKGEAEEALAEFMNAGSPLPLSWKRVYCCHSSRYLYCDMCCRLLVPPSEIPPALTRERGFQLPFDVHILLDDKRPSSTGVQVRSIFQTLEMQSSSSDKDGENERENPQQQQQQHRVQLFDIKREEFPSYKDHHDGGVYLLFPGDDSVPLSTVLNTNTLRPPRKLTTLVVLDCKWATPSARFHPSLANLPKVSLDHPPERSYFWRWHQAGPGMLSTVEALYFAAWQITASLGWTLEERKRLVNLLWLFRLQRSIIQSKYETNQVQTVNPHVPFTEEAKEFARKLRRQHLRNTG